MPLPRVQLMYRPQGPLKPSSNYSWTVPELAARLLLPPPLQAASLPNHVLSQGLGSLMGVQGGGGVA